MEPRLKLIYTELPTTDDRSETLTVWNLRKLLNRSRCRLGCRLGWTQGTTSPDAPCERAILRGRGGSL